MDVSFDPPDPRPRHPEFHDLREQVMSLFYQGRYEDALDAARDLRSRYPERGEIPFWMACALGSLARPDDALQVLEQALDDGLWWPAEWLRDDDDLALLRGRPELEAMTERAQRARATWVSSYEPGLIVGKPASRFSVPRGTLVALHGWGGNAPDFLDPWRPVVDEGLLLAVPESSQVLTPYFHVWDDPSLATKDLANAYKRLRSTYGIDALRLVAAGFSQGGGLAVSSVLTGGPLPADAFLTIGTGLSDINPAALDTVAPTRTHQIQGWILIGERDEALPDATRLHAELRSRDIDCHFEVIPHVAHSVAPDLAPRLRRALASLLPHERPRSHDRASDSPST